MSVMQKFRDGGVRIETRPARINWRIYWLGQVWWLAETWHFGWNLWPVSDAKVICDGIFALILALALVVPSAGSSR